MKFKVGDLVRIIEDCSGCEKACVYPLHNGDAQGHNKKFLFAWNLEVHNIKSSGCYCQENWELITNKKSEAGKKAYKTFLKTHERNNDGTFSVKKEEPISHRWFVTRSSKLAEHRELLRNLNNRVTELENKSDHDTNVTIKNIDWRKIELEIYDQLKFLSVSSVMKIMNIFRQNI